MRGARHLESGTGEEIPPVSLPGEVFGLLTSLGVVLVASSYPSGRRDPNRTRPSISGVNHAAGPVVTRVGFAQMLLGLTGLLVGWVLSWRNGSVT